MKTSSSRNANPKAPKQRNEKGPNFVRNQNSGIGESIVFDVQFHWRLVLDWKTSSNRQKAQHDFAERDFIAQFENLRRIIANRFVIDAGFIGAAQMGDR